MYKILMEKLVKILVEKYVYTYKWTDLLILSIGWFYRGAINFRSRHIKFRSRYAVVKICKNCNRILQTFNLIIQILTFKSVYVHAYVRGCEYFCV